MKHNDILKFDYIMCFDKSDNYQSTIKFSKYMENLFASIINILYEFKNKSQFSRWLKDKGFYNNHNTGAACIEDLIYDSSRKCIFSIKFKVLTKLENIILSFYSKGSIDFDDF